MLAVSARAVAANVSAVFPAGNGYLRAWPSAEPAPDATTLNYRNGASITHHHAVGRDHKPWLAEEIGPVGVMILRAVKDRLDPTGILNPGVLIP